MFGLFFFFLMKPEQQVLSYILGCLLLHNFLKTASHKCLSLCLRPDHQSQPCVYFLRASRLSKYQICSYLLGVWASGLTSCLATRKSFISCMRLISVGRWEGNCKYLHEHSFGNVAKRASCVKCRSVFTWPLKHDFPTKSKLREFNSTAHIFATKPFTFWLHQSNLVAFFSQKVIFFFMIAWWAFFLGQCNM